MLLLQVGGASLGDSTGPLTGLDLRLPDLMFTANALLDTALRRDAHGVNWMGLEEQRRAARRNPTLGLAPELMASEYLLSSTVDHIPDPLWGQLRQLGAVTGARFAVAPAAIRITGSEGAFTATYVIVVADVRTGEVMFRARTQGRPAATTPAALRDAAAAIVASPLR